LRTVKECDMARWDAGVLAYGAADFWGAHEQWEAVWNGLADGALRDLVRAAIQVAAARHRAARLQPDAEGGAAIAAGIGRIAARARTNAARAPLASLGAWIGAELETIELCVRSLEHHAASAAPALDWNDRLALASALRPTDRSAGGEPGPAPNRQPLLP
jgi:hypothetical protein